MHNYVARDDDRAGPRILKDSKTLGSAYDRYLQSAVTSNDKLILSFTLQLLYANISCYLILKQLSSITSGEASAISGSGLPRAAAVGMHGLPTVDPAGSILSGNGAPELAPNGRSVNFGGQLPVDAVNRPGSETVPLPPDATPTLYVEGLPPDSTRREVARILFAV